MKKYFIFVFLSFLISSTVFARSTGCKEGNCENGFGKWIYTDKTTYEGENGLQQKNRVKEQRLGLMDISIKVNLKIVCGVDKEF